MRTLKLALAAVAAFAFNANAQQTPMIGMGDGTQTNNPPAGLYQPPVVANSAPNNQGFHAGGVAACDGCHVMHNATDGRRKSTAAGSTAAPWSGVTNMYLLQGSDQSSTCLICHSGRGAGSNTQFTVLDTQATNDPLTGAANRTPGGDFAWIAKSWTNSPSQNHGHNVEAADFSIRAEDGRTAPGGTWTNGAGRKKLACSSCHDPHGRYRVQLVNGVETFVGPGANGQLDATALPIAASGSYGQDPSPGVYAVGTYRLLAGQYYTPISNGSSPFANDPPAAVAPKTYNPATGEARVAYGTGMSEWCQNCHGTIHIDAYNSGVAGLRHPAGSDSRFHSTQVQVYNTYVSSGKVATQTNPYTALVPFELGKDKDRLALVTALTGNLSADSQSNVMCLSCHRAHASAFDSMVRWDQNATFLTDGQNYTAGVTNRQTSVTRAGYYDRNVGTGTDSIGLYQRSLCNKCHGKD